MYSLGANNITTPLIHPVVNVPAAGGVRVRTPGHPVRPRRIRERPLIHPILAREICDVGGNCRGPGLSLGPDVGIVEQARNAAGWIKEQIKKFFDLERRLSLGHHQAAQLEAAAKAAGNIEAAQAAAAERASAFELLLDYDKVKGRIEDLLAKVPGLGLIPVAVLIASGAAIIAVAAAMAAIFRRATAQESALELIAAGVLTPKEAERMNLEREGTLFSGLGMAGGVGSLVALTVAIAVGLPILSDALGR